MKRFSNYLVIAFVLLCVVLTGCFLQKRDTVKIGIIIPMTGAGAATVDYWVNGFNMAIEELNAQDSGAKYELLFEDCNKFQLLLYNCHKVLNILSWWVVSSLWPSHL